MANPPKRKNIILPLRDIETVVKTEPIETHTEVPEKPAEPVVVPPRPLPDVVPGTVGPSGYVPHGSIQRVECPVIPGLFVWYNLAIAYEFRRADYEAPGANRVEKACRKMDFLVDHFEGWNIPHPLVPGEFIPCPVKGDWESYRPICMVFGFLTEIAGWIMNDGITLALDTALGNSRPASTTP